MLSVAVGFGCANPDAAKTSEDGESTEDANTEGAATDGPDPRSLLVPDGFRLCSVPPAGESLGDEFFRNRAILDLEAGSYPFGNEPSSEIGMVLTTDVSGSVAAIQVSDVVLEVLPDTLPSLLSLNVDPAPEHSTAHYRATFTANGIKSTLNVWMGQFPEQVGSDFDLGPLVAADLSRLRKVHIAGFGNGIYAPCDGTSGPLDRVDAVLSDGAVSFDTRPAWWGGSDGFTVHAVGEIDGISFEVSSYWDLEYSTRSFEHAYGLLPTLGVRFGERPGGECILVIAHDAITDEYVGALLDCAQQHLRDVAVESVTFTAGGGG